MMSTTPSYENALTRIANGIRENPDTSGGVQLRRFLWSLYNMHHFVNLWTLASRVSGPVTADVAEVMTAALCGGLQEDDIKRALLVAGEMERWDAPGNPDPAEEQLAEVEQILRGLLKSAPPGALHTGVGRLLEDVVRLRDEIN